MNIQHYFTALDNNTNATLQLAKSFTIAQLNKSEDGKWSLLQIFEHIYLTDKIIIFIINRPSENLHTNDELLGNEKLQHFLIDEKNRKIKAPERLEPKGDIADVTAFEKLFIAQRNLLKQQIESGKIGIDNRLHKHPLLGEMTISDWLYFLIHHTQRHLEQAKERFGN